MGIIAELEPIFGTTKLPDIFDFIPCSQCYSDKQRAVWICAECGTDGKDAYYCDRHVQRVPEHVDVDDNGKRKRHYYKRINDEMSSEELKEEFSIRLNPAVNDLQAQLMAEKLHLNHAVKEAKHMADHKIMKL